MRRVGTGYGGGSLHGNKNGVEDVGDDLHREDSNRQL